MADTTQIDGEVTTFAYTLLNDATAADARTTLGLVIGTDVQAEDAGLTSIAGLTTAANTLIYTTALDTYAVIASANSSLLVTSGAGVPSLSTAIPDGVTATTQAASDNSTKVATTSYVDSAVGGVGGGKVLQVVSTTLTTTFTTTSTSYVDLTGLSLSITPASTSNKILLICHVNMQTSASQGNAMQLMRGSTAICVGTSVSSRTASTSSVVRSSDAISMQNVGVTFLDSPASVSALTYKVQLVNTQAGTIYVNRTATDTDSSTYQRGASTITAIEIDGT